MAEERYQATEKVTQKMTRDGLVTKKGKQPEEIPENPGLKKRQKVPERFRDPAPDNNPAQPEETTLQFGSGSSDAYRTDRDSDIHTNSNRASPQKKIQRFSEQHPASRETPKAARSASSVKSGKKQKPQQDPKDHIAETPTSDISENKIEISVPRKREPQSNTSQNTAATEMPVDANERDLMTTASGIITQRKHSSAMHPASGLKTISAGHGRTQETKQGPTQNVRSSGGSVRSSAFHETREKGSGMVRPRAGGKRLREETSGDPPTTRPGVAGRLRFEDEVRKGVGMFEEEFSEERDENDALRASEASRNVLRSSSRRMQKRIAVQRHRPKRTSRFKKERKKGVSKDRSFFVNRKDPMRMLFWVMVFVLVLVVFVSLLAGGAVLSVGGNGVVLTTYPNSDETIYAAENEYRKLEQELEAQLTTISLRYPGYQEYHMDLDDIGHDPYQLISYLTTYHWNFEYEDVEEEIHSLFEDQYELEVTPGTRERNGKTISVLNVRLINHGLDTVCRERMDEEQVQLYDALNTTKGNRDYLFNESNTSWGGDEYTNYSVPEEALSDEQFARMLREAEKYLGWPYVWGGSSPSDGGFDCSGYVCWVVNNCGNGWNVGRTTAEGLRRMCAYVSPADARPGDLVFFEGTYNTEGASHVGIYVGNGMMINAGDPIKYANIHSSYWEPHFMQFGRLPGANPGTASRSSEFTEEDRRLLADCIYWEARGQSYECQCYVGQVILNRVYDRRYPNTIRGVIGQPGQYANGIRSSPEPCYAAADAVLSGQVAMPRNVIYQAQFQQGSGVWKYLEGEYFCYG